MYKFIDLSGSQNGIDLVRAGVDGGIVKASGANDGLYVANGYSQHIANIRTAFGNAGHYFFNGPEGTPTTAADYFVTNLIWRDGDAMFLDVEEEDERVSIPDVDMYSPEEAYEFALRVRERKGLVPGIYASESVLNGLDWSKCIQLGCLPWVAKWGSNNGEPNTPPRLSAQWGSYAGDGWPAWQYTSQAIVPGWSLPVDLNQFKIRIDEVHSKEAAYMAELQECYRTLTTAFGVTGPFYDALGHRGADYKRTARQTIIAYDDMVVEYVGYTPGLGTVIGLRRKTIGGFAGYAHVYAPPRVGTEIKKGAVICYVASSGDGPGSLWSGPHIHTTQSYVSSSNAALGVRPLSDPAPAIAKAISSGAPAGGGTTPINEINPGGNAMYFLRTTDTTVNIVTDTGFEPIQSPQHLNLLQRFVKAYPSFDTFNAAERDIILFYIAASRDFDDAQFRELRDGIANIKVTVDSATIAQQVTSEVSKYLADHGIDVNYDEIGLTVEELLKDDFAAIPGAVVYAQGKALANG